MGLRARRVLPAVAGVLVLVAVLAVVVLRPRTDEVGGGQLGGPLAPAPTPAPGLAIGIDESNPHLFAPGTQPAAFAPWADRLRALHPRYVRLRVDWAKLQPARDTPPDFSVAADGCLRGLPPCAPFAGLRDELAAARAGGLLPVISVYGTPTWAAGGDCGSGRAAVPSLDDYATLIDALIAEVRSAGVARWWLSPWNEPNNPDFLAQCGTRGQDAAHIALRASLRPGAPPLALGDTAGYDKTGERATSAADVATAMPDALLCARGSVWAQHGYVKVDDRFAAQSSEAKRDRILRDVEAATRRGPACVPPIWITETGTGSQTGAGGCRAMGDQLRHWAKDPRVDAAFQYTFREDTAFRVGLADESLTTLRPAYAAWLAASKGDPDPAAACAT